MMSRRTVQRAAVVLAVVAAATAFRYFELGQYLTLASAKESHRRYLALYEAHGPLVIAGYMAVYILVTSLSLPGAAVMTIAGGALFGLWTGTVAISFASSIGATVACAVCRFLLRDWVQARFAERIAKINEGIEREGAFYLFTLRLVPVFPFWLINLAMGLTTMRLSTFYWVSQLGMLPATIVYVNAGRELARIDSIRGIFSPSLLASFAFLGLFPLIARRAVQWYRKRR